MRAEDVLGRVILVTGKEEFLSARTVDDVRSAVRGYDPESEISDASAADLTLAALGELSAPSLFSSVRCVVVRRLEVGVVLHEVLGRRLGFGFGRSLSSLDDVLSVWWCARDPETPLAAKGMMMAALAYFVLPTDVIPDVLAGVGFTDDAAVIAALLAVVGKNVKARHREAARKFLNPDPQ